MPDFQIDGDPGAILSRAATMREKGDSFISVAEGLEALSTEGWSGRAADRFRDRFDPEPGKWRDAGSGFVTAASALEWYAEALEQAKTDAAAAAAEHERGDRVTEQARADYDADVARGRRQKASAEAAGQTFHLTILPFHDPGEEIRQAALSSFATTKQTLENAAHACAGRVRAGCAAAPEKRNWFESGLAFVGGVFAGAGEAVFDLLEMGFNFTFGPYVDLAKLATGELTPEELAMKNQMKVEDAQALFNAMKDDPVGFGKNLGKALLDWDTWADDPARALGHLVPDAIAAVATGGAGALATRGAKVGEDVLGALADMRHMDDMAGLTRTTDGLADLRRLDNLPEDLLDAVHTPVEDLSPGQMRELMDARDLVKVEPGTPMQRVITPDDVRDYLRGESDDNRFFSPNETFGYTARQEDVAHLRTPQEMFDGLGLDYEGTRFRAEGDTLGPNEGGTAVDEMHYIQYRAGAADEVMVPRDSSLGGDGSFDAQARDPDNPFTGNGYTKGGIPEFRTDGATTLEPGSEIWRVDAAGERQLVATLTDQGTWLAVPR